MKIDQFNLTDEAKYLLAKMYGEYLQRRRSGTNRKQAKYFGFVEDVQLFIPKYNYADTLDVCKELLNAKMIDADPGSNNLSDIGLSNIGIAVMEQSFVNGLEKVLKYAAKLGAMIFNAAN